MSSITEQRHPASMEMDRADGQALLDILCTCDGEILEGAKAWPQYDGVGSESVRANMERVSEGISKAFTVWWEHREEEAPGAGVILSGCGTSGRLAHFVCRSFNRLIASALDSRPHTPFFHYLIAGGDRALVTAQELAEDSPAHGLKDLQAVRDRVMGKESKEEEGRTEGQTEGHLVYIGITCGMSAPYVAGQLIAASTDGAFECASVLGFNPLELARHVAVEGWDCTVREALEQSVEAGKGKVVLVNPVVGSEPLCGSTRMKGGTATKILLECMCARALVDAHGDTFALHPSVSSNSVGAILEEFYGAVYSQTYAETHREAWAGLVEAAGAALRAGGRIRYFGADALGVLAFIDASEQVPTFGADHHDVRGFIRGGWKDMDNSEGDLSMENGEGGDLSAVEQLYSIGSEAFLESHADEVGNDDVSVFVYAGHQDKSVLEAWEEARGLVAGTQFLLLLNVEEGEDGEEGQTEESNNGVVRVCVEPAWLVCTKAWRMAAGVELATKWVLNAVSTGAHVLKGKVYSNLMIDVRLSNNKLFHRALRIVSQVCGVEEGDETPRMHLLRAIWGDDEWQVHVDAPISTHIERAVVTPAVVPVTLLLTLQLSDTAADARDKLEQQPLVSKWMGK